MSEYGWDDPYKAEKEAFDKLMRAQTLFRARIIKSGLAKTQFDPIIDETAITQCGKPLKKCTIEEVDKLIEWISQKLGEKQ